jgi:outer membrane lipoprotein-sorting protein
VPRAVPFGVLLASAWAALVSLGTIPVPAGAQTAGTPAATPVLPSALPALSGTAQELDAFASTWAGVTAYSTTVTISERKGTQVQTAVYDYTFRKPSHVTLHVVSGASAGATLVWDGGDTVVLHRGSGLAALFKKTVSLHDPLVTTIRGSSVDQLNFSAILAHAHEASGSVSQAPGDLIDGVLTDAVTLIPLDPAVDAGLSREVIEISPTTHLPMRVLGYDGPTVVRQIDFADVKLER